MNFFNLKPDSVFLTDKQKRRIKKRKEKRRSKRRNKK